MILLEILRGVWESFRETLPSDEREAGVFVAGLAYGLLIYLGVLLLTSWGTLVGLGGR
jgi:hypothetical protein